MVARSAIVETFVDVEVGDEGLVPVLCDPHELRLSPGVGQRQVKAGGRRRAAEMPPCSRGLAEPGTASLAPISMGIVAKTQVSPHTRCARCDQTASCAKLTKLVGRFDSFTEHAEDFWVVSLSETRFYVDVCVFHMLHVQSVWRQYSEVFSDALECFYFLI